MDDGDSSPLPEPQPEGDEAVEEQEMVSTESRSRGSKADRIEPTF